MNEAISATVQSHIEDYYLSLSVSRSLSLSSFLALACALSVYSELLCSFAADIQTWQTHTHTLTHGYRVERTNKYVFSLWNSTGTSLYY